MFEFYTVIYITKLLKIEKIFWKLLYALYNFKQNQLL